MRTGTVTEIEWIICEQIFLPSLREALRLAGADLPPSRGASVGRRGSRGLNKIQPFDSIDYKLTFQVAEVYYICRKSPRDLQDLREKRDRYAGHNLR